MKHYSVLSKEIIEKLNIKKNGIYVDATLGLGGHTKLIAEKAIDGKVISFDQDKKAIDEAKKRLKDFKNIIFINDNFENLKKRINKLNIEKIDGIIYDLGTSYYQLTDNERGFTYHGETKLDMRMNQDSKLSAIEIINDYSVEDLTEIFYKYGNENQSKKIAIKIDEFRKNIKIEKNTQLNEIIKSVKGYSKDKHPSKNIFQAIRIKVNDEINVIEKSLSQAIELLKKNAILEVITFHSLEDRTVKNIFWKYKNDIEITPMGNNHKYKSFKTIYPKKDEIEKNKSSRSAKLRILKKLID